MISTAGIVSEVDGSKAFVKISRNTACENCGACHFDETTLNLQVTAINEAGAKVGDRVELSMDNVNYFTASLFLYGLPLFTLLIGIFFGLIFYPKWGVEPNDIYAILTGLLLMTITFIILRMFKDKFADNKNYMSIITRVIPLDNMGIKIELNKH